MKHWLFPAETLLLPFVALLLFWSTWLGVPLRQPQELYISRLLQCIAVYATGLLIALCVQRFRDIGLHRSYAESWHTFNQIYLCRRSLFRDFRLLNALALMFFCFVQLKHFTPFIRTKIFDEWFFKTEKLIFNGKLLTEHVQHIFGIQSADWLSAAYLAFYPFTASILGFFLLQRKAFLAQRFVFAFSLSWLIGILLVHLFPTWGPCFFSPELVSGLPVTEVTKVQETLWRHWLFLKEYPDSNAGVFLISGFPSLHLTVPLLAMFFAFRISTLVFALSSLMFLLTAISTIYFGWHYALDDLGAVGLAWFAYRAAGWAVPTTTKLRN